MKVIHELTKSRTVLLISHRLANVVDSDKIYMLKDGKIAEAGSHAELMRQAGAYRRLFEEQSQLERFAEGRRDSHA